MNLMMCPYHDMIKKVFVVCIIIFVAALFFYYDIRNSAKDSLAKRLDEWGVSINQTGFTLTDFSESSSGGLAKETFEAESDSAEAQDGKVIFKMTRIQTVAPQKYIDDKKFILESLFLPITSPYPGAITNVIECPEEFKPKVHEVENGTIYTLFAGERFAYGICAEDLVAYYSTFGIFDCKERGIFEVRIFSKTKEQLQPLIRSFVCG